MGEGHPRRQKLPLAARVGGGETTAARVDSVPDPAATFFRPGGEITAAAAGLLKLSKVEGKEQMKFTSAAEGSE